MKPEVKNGNVAQILITLTLVGILVCLLGLYIYYGMNQARVSAPVAEVTVPEAAPVDIEDARRQEIIEALKNQPIATSSIDRRVIINSLKQDPVETNTEETEKKRQEIVNALQNN